MKPLPIAIGEIIQAGDCYENGEPIHSEFVGQKNLVLKFAFRPRTIRAETERQPNGMIICWVIMGFGVLDVKASPIAQVVFDWLDHNYPGIPNSVNIQDIIK